MGWEAKGIMFCSRCTPKNAHTQRTGCAYRIEISVLVVCGYWLVTIFGGAASTARAASNEVHGTSNKVAAVQDFWVEQLVEGMKFPSSMAWLPDGDILVVEREGGLRAIRNGILDPAPLSGTPPSFQNIYNGLKDIAVDPDFKTNRTLYLLISEGSYDRHHAAVYQARHETTRLTNVKRIFISKDGVGGIGHIAGRMAFRSDKTLLIAIAEDGHHKHLAQRLDSHIGKVLRINRDGSVPRDNPFLDIPNALPEIWSYGHRVPTGLYVEPGTDTVWELEPGPIGGDELNRLKAGGNFGWARSSWGFEDGLVAGPLKVGVEMPILVWMPFMGPSGGAMSVTPSGLTRLQGAEYPLWQGDFLVGHMTGRAIERLRIEGNRIVLRETLLTGLNERIRDVAVGPDHHIYILTDHPNGRLLRLRLGHPQGQEMKRVARELSEMWTGGRNNQARSEPGDPEKGKQAFLERCSGCHSAGTIVRGGEIGPDLANVYGRKAGSGIDFSYSAALAESPQVWDAVSLNLFLANPSGYAPGTTMATSPLIDEEVRREIVGFLRQASSVAPVAAPK